MSWSVWTCFIYGGAAHKRNGYSKSAWRSGKKHCISPIERVYAADHYCIWGICADRLLFHEPVVKQLCLSYSTGRINFYNCNHQFYSDCMDNSCTTSNKGGDSKPCEIATNRIKTVSYTHLTLPTSDLV